MRQQRINLIIFLLLILLLSAMIQLDKVIHLPLSIINNTILNLQRITQNVKYQDEILLKKLDKAAEKYCESRNIDHFQDIQHIYSSDMLKRVENQRNQMLASLKKTLKQHHLTQTTIRQLNKPILKQLKNKGQMMNSRDWIHYQKIVEKLSQNSLLQEFNLQKILERQNLQEQTFIKQIELQKNYLLYEVEHFLLECDQIFEQHRKQQLEKSFLSKLQHIDFLTKKLNCFQQDIFPFSQQDYKKNQQIQNSFISTNVDTNRNQGRLMRWSTKTFDL